MISILFEYKEFVFLFIVCSIPFYLIFYKYNKNKLDFNKEEEKNKKLAYSNRVDIIASKVYLFPILIIVIITGCFKVLSN